MKKKIIFGILLVVVFVAGIFVGRISVGKEEKGNELKEYRDANVFTIANKKYEMKEEDILNVSPYDSDTLEILFNEKEYDKTPVLFNGVTIGSSIDDVIEGFGLIKGYAMVDMEVDAYDDATDVLYFPYVSKEKSLDRDFLNANVSFHMIEEDGKWKLISQEEYEDEGLTFIIGFYGDDDNGMFKKNKVSSIYVMYE